jgi:hypothetical protein
VHDQTFAAQAIGYSRQWTFAKVWEVCRFGQIRREGIEMTTQQNSSKTQQDWFHQGKEDAWLGRLKQAPEHDPQAASWYDLGYGEGSIQASPSKTHG